MKSYKVGDQFKRDGATFQVMGVGRATHGDLYHVAKLGKDGKPSKHEADQDLVSQSSMDSDDKQAKDAKAKTKDLKKDDPKSQAAKEESRAAKVAKRISEASTPDAHQKRVLMDTVRNPDKALMGGPSVADAKKTLKSKFGMTDAQIAALEKSEAKEAKRTDAEIKARIQAIGPLIDKAENENEHATAKKLYQERVDLRSELAQRSLAAKKAQGKPPLSGHKSTMGEAEKKIMLYAMHSETDGKRKIGEFETLKAAAAKADELEDSGKWPEGFDAVAVMPDGSKKMWTGEWENA